MARLLASALLALQVTAATADAVPRDIHDIRGPLQLQFSPPFAMTGGTALLLVGLLYLRRKVRRPVISAMPEAVADEPDTADLLTRLSEDFRQGRCAGDQAIARLDALMRNELDIRAEIPARQSTTLELSARLDQSMWLDAETRAQLARFLALCDHVKFSAYRPRESEVEAALATVRTVCDRIATRQPA